MDRTAIQSLQMETFAQFLCFQQAFIKKTRGSYTLESWPLEELNYCRRNLLLSVFQVCTHVGVGKQPGLFKSQ